jgi:hypothetical protein
MTDEKKEGFTYETRDDGITEVDWEGEVYQPSEFEARDVAAGGGAFNPMKHVPGLSFTETLGEGITHGVAGYIKEGMESGFFSGEAVKAGMDRGSEYIRHDLEKGGLGRSTSKMAFGLGRDVIQQSANRVAGFLDPDRTIADGDVGIFFGEPLAPISMNPVEKFGQHAAGYAALWFSGGGLIKWAAPKALALPGVAKATSKVAPLIQKLTPGAQKILQGASTKAGNLSKIKIGNANIPFTGMPWQQAVLGAGKLYADGLVPGFIYDYTFTEVGPTGQYEELENGMQKWIADNNWTLERITDDTKLSDAYLQTAAVGTLYGGLFNGIFKTPSAYKAFNKYRNFRKLEKQRIEGQKLAQLLDAKNQGDAPIKERLANLTVQEKRRLIAQGIMHPDDFKQGELFSPEKYAELERLDLIVREDAPRAESIIAATPTDAEMVGEAAATGQALQKAAQEGEIDVHTQPDLDLNGEPNTKVSLDQNPGTKPLARQTRMEKTSNLFVDPETYQYKADADPKTGSVGSIDPKTAYNPRLAGYITVWKNPADGKTYVVNGHNRHAKAVQEGIEDQLVWDISDEAATAADARRIAATDNIVDGRGTALDAAKLFRESDLTKEQWLERGVSLRGEIGNVGFGLSQLPEDVYKGVVQGSKDFYKKAALIGQANLGEEVTRDLYKTFKKTPAVTLETIQEAIVVARDAQVGKGDPSLFDFLEDGGKEFKALLADQETNFLKLTRTRVLLKKRLKETIDALKGDLKGADTETAKAKKRAGTKIGPKTPKDLQVAQEVLQRFDLALANPDSEASKVFRKIIEKQGKKKFSLTTAKSVIKEHMEELREALEDSPVFPGDKTPVKPVKSPKAKARVRRASKKVTQEAAKEEAVLGDQRFQAPEVPPKPEPISTAVTKADKKTPISAFLRQAPEEMQGEIAIQRLLDAMNKFNDGFKREGRTSIDTVGDLANLLNVARVATEESVQKALRDVEKIFVFLQQDTADVLPFGRTILKMASEDRKALLLDRAGNLDADIQALGPEPKKPRRSRNKTPEAIKAFDERNRIYNEYWKKRNALEEQKGLIDPWDEEINNVKDEDLDKPLSILPEFARKTDLGNGVTSKLRQEVAFLAELRKIVKEVAGVDVQVEIRPTLEGYHDAGSAAAYGTQEGTFFTAYGQFGPREITGELDDLVLLSMGSKEYGRLWSQRDMVMAAYHESFHRIQTRFLTARELRLLQRNDKAIRKLAARVVDAQLKTKGSDFARQLLDGTISSDEAQAIAFSGWWQFGDLYKQATWAEPFRKLAEITQRIANFLKTRKFNTWEEIFEESFYGEMSQRPELRGPDKKANMRARQAQKGTKKSLTAPNGPMMSVNNNSMPPDMGDGDPDFAVRFARLLEDNKERIASGEITRAQLWAENNYQKVRSESGKYVYNYQSEDLLEGMNAMTRAEARSRAELTGATQYLTTMDGVEVQRLNHKWFEDRGADGSGILSGLKSLTKGFQEYEIGALHRAMDFADKLQLKAQIEATKWKDVDADPTLDKRIQLARLVTSADSARRMHLAIMNITRRWGQLGQEMQLPRDIDTYELPEMAWLPEVAEEVSDGPPPTGSVVEQAIADELRVPAGTNPAMEELADKFLGVREALETGEIDIDATVSADEIADTMLILGESPGSAEKTFNHLKELDPAEAQGQWIKGLHMLRSSNLISGGVTATKASVNGIFNMNLLAIEQAGGFLMQGDYERALYSAQMIGSYFNNLRMGFRNAAIGFKTGRPIGNLDRTTIDALGKAAEVDAQGELIAQNRRTGLTVNTLDMEEKFAKTSTGKLFNALWQALGTPGIRLAVTVDSFNSTVAGWSYEFFRHMPRGMELAVNRGHKKYSKEAFEEAYAYAQKRVDGAVKDAVIDGKNLTEVALDSPHAQDFMDAVNFTENIQATMETRSIEDGFNKGKAQGLEGQELLEYAQNWVKEGDWLQKVAHGMTNDWAVTPGRIGSIPGVLLTEGAKMPLGIGPVVKFVQPFMRVPTNILKAVARRTPAAVLVDTWWRDIASSDPGARARAMGQVVMGSSALALLWGANNMGRMRSNGGGPREYAAREKWLKDRQMPYSIQFWDDDANYWGAPISMAALEPFSTLFGALGDYNDAQAMMTNEERDACAESLCLDIIRMQAGGLLSQTYFTGISELVDAAFDKNMVTSGSNRQQAMERFLYRTISTMIPYSSALRQARQEVDQTPRRIEPDTIETGMMSYWNETWATIKNGIPGMSEENPPILDWSSPGAEPVQAPHILYSRDMAENYPWMAAVAQYTPPFGAFKRGRQIDDPITQVLVNLHGKGTAFLGPVASDFQRKDLYLSPSELNEYRRIFATTKISGLTWRDRMMQLISTENWQALGRMDEQEGISSKEPSRQAAQVQKLITEYKKEAKKNFKLYTAKGRLIADEEKKSKKRKTQTEVIMQNKSTTSEFNQKVNY